MNKTNLAISVMFLLLSAATVARAADDKPATTKKVVTEIAWQKTGDNAEFVPSTQPGHKADVLKITGKHLPSLGHQEHDTGHGKLSAHLDLRESKDVETLRGLVREADVFSQGYRPGALGNRGFSPEALAQLRPGIVAISMCAFSSDGSLSSGVNAAVIAIDAKLSGSSMLKR